MYFNKDTNTFSNYTIKDNNITLNIGIKTINMYNDNNSIKIEYLIKDSNNKYEYYIEMSDL